MWIFVSEINANGDNLLPSESKGWEVGFEIGTPQEGVFGLAYFHQDLYDIIGVNSVSGLPDNLWEADIKGVEAGYSMMASDSLGFRLTYTWLEAVDVLTDEPLPLMAEDRIDLTFVPQGGEELLAALDKGSPIGSALFEKFGPYARDVLFLVDGKRDVKSIAFLLGLPEYAIVDVLEFAIGNNILVK